MRRLVMWDIDRTLLIGGGVAAQAWKTAFTAVTGRPWQAFPVFGGRTDLDICAEVFAVHGVTDCTPEAFFARYVDEVHATRHRFAEDGHLLPGVREVLAALAVSGHVTQTVVTGNIPAVAALKLAAFNLGWAFDADVGGYGTDDSVRATLVRRSRERAEAKYGTTFDVVVIGDTVNDVDAALADGATVVAVATGQTSAEDLRAAGAHHVLPDLSDVDRAVQILGCDRVR
jgi:phosphoglycolate phosphatase-like HAD superfamily hydrolase